MDEKLIELEGRVHALTLICAAVIACHPEQAMMRTVLSNAKKEAEAIDDVQLAPYRAGMLAVHTALERAVETRAQADLVRNLGPGPSH